ncbi:MAG TPA: carnitine 3-dehydrogenase [Solirubrobacteraceae bacterium]|nr:carnitine 3-dehydrogenase [Solirubrobacteraceae bacterium]
MADGAVGLLGGGVIGGGWAARYLLNGIDVRIYDPAPDAARRLDDVLAGARRAFGRLTLAPLPPEGTLSFVDTVPAAVAGALIVHESAPERVELKQELLARASAASGPETLLFSSTSGLLPSQLQAGIDHPERFAVAHPFNPVYLLPLVELSGGELTGGQTLERASEWFAGIGMHPLRVRVEIDGFLADRLLEALWREALWLVHDGVATVAEVDDALRYGAGVRMALMGPYLTYRIAGGEQGMRHFMAQFGPALKWPWTKLTDVPELTDEFIDRLAAESDEQVQGRSTVELERMRDDCLVALLQALRTQDQGAGATLARWERGLMGLAGAQSLAATERIVPAEWIDYNGHVTESRYLQLAADATDALLARLGLGPEYIESTGSYYTVETHICHIGALHAGDHVTVATQVLGGDEKRLHVFHEVKARGADGPAATAEHLLLHVDAASGRVGPAQGEVRERALELIAEHADLARPARAGRRIEPVSGSVDRARDAG